MEPTVVVLNHTRRPVDEALLAEVARRTLLTFGPDRPAEVCIVVVGARRMRALNRRYHGRRGLTDVLAFAQEEGPDFPGEPAGLGDVVLSWDAAAAQAAARGHSVDTELAFLTAHGVLHLLGSTDVTAADRADMFARQKQILAQVDCTLVAEDAILSSTPGWDPTHKET